MHLTGAFVSKECLEMSAPVGGMSIGKDAHAIFSQSLAGD